jgi:hypothetical protein
MTCGEALRISRLIAEGSYYAGEAVCDEVAERLEQHWRRMCECATRLAPWPLNRKPVHIDWELFDDG